MSKSAKRFVKAAFLVPWLVVSLAVFAEDEGKKSPDESQPKLKPGWEKLLKPKPGTEWLNGMPKEIVWLKDGAEMVLVPGGEFLFGEAKEKREEPTFYIDKFPVTNEQYAKFVEETKHPVPQVPQDWAKPYNWRLGTYPEGQAKYPAVLVSWYDVVAYCRWAGKAFPSETHWEKAARGADGRKYPWGDEFEKGKCNSYLEGIEKTTPVDKYPNGVSPYGCYDMAGNIWEWTTTPRVAGYVLKGGSWFDGDLKVQTTASGWARPQEKAANTGFRCAIVLPQ